jgi:hypothetical protein
LPSAAAAAESSSSKVSARISVWVFVSPPISFSIRAWMRNRGPSRAGSGVMVKSL